MTNSIPTCACGRFATGYCVACHVPVCEGQQRLTRLLEIVDGSCGRMRDGRMLCLAHAIAEDEQALVRAAQSREDWSQRVIELARQAVPVLERQRPPLQLALTAGPDSRTNYVYMIARDVGPGWLISEAADYDGHKLYLALDWRGSLYYSHGGSSSIGQGSKTIFGKYRPSPIKRTPVVAGCTLDVKRDGSDGRGGLLFSPDMASKLLDSVERDLRAILEHP